MILDPDVAGARIDSLGQREGEIAAGSVEVLGNEGFR